MRPGAHYSRHTFAVKFFLAGVLTERDSILLGIRILESRRTIIHVGCARGRSTYRTTLARVRHRNRACFARIFAQILHMRIAKGLSSRLASARCCVLTGPAWQTISYNSSYN